MNDYCSEKSGHLVVSLHVQPRASKTEVVGLYGGALKVRIQSPPIDGKANEEIIVFFSKILGIAKSALRIKVGSVSRKKTLEITGVTKQYFLDKIKCQS